MNWYTLAALLLGFWAGRVKFQRPCTHCDNGYLIQSANSMGTKFTLCDNCGHTEFI